MSIATVLDPVFGFFHIPDDTASVALFTANLTRGRGVISFKPHLRESDVYPICYAPNIAGGEAPHTHTFLELFIIVQGRGVHTSGSQQVEISRGDIVFTNNTSAHYFSKCDDDFRVANICFLPSALGYSNAALDDARAANHYALLVPFAEYEAREQFTVVRPDEGQFKRIAWYTFHMIETFHGGGEREIVINALKNVLLMAIPRGSLSADANDARFHEILSYIRDHAHDDITSASVAGHFGFSAAYFSTMFNRICGDTLHGYVNRLRVRKAKELIERTTLPINRIAHEVGYHNISHFNVAFKRVLRRSPGSFRERSKSTRGAKVRDAAKKQQTGDE